LHHNRGLRRAALVTTFVGSLFLTISATAAQEPENPLEITATQADLQELNLSTAQELNNSSDRFCVTPVYPAHVEDLHRFPQDIEVYADKNALTHKRLYDIQKAFSKQYFSVWDYKRPPESSAIARWPFRVYSRGESYGENLQLLEE